MARRLPIPRPAPVINAVTCCCEFKRVFYPLAQTVSSVMRERLCVYLASILRCSLRMQLSMTTSRPAARALPAASSWTTPSCIQMPFAPMRMAASTISGTHSGTAENIDNIDAFGNLVERGPDFLAQDFSLIRIYRNNPVATRLHVLGDSIARPRAPAGKPHYRDRLSVPKKILACHRHSHSPSASIFALLPASGAGIRRASEIPVQRADAHAPQFLHQMAEMLEHDADLLVAAFDQLDFVPGIVAAADQPQTGWRGAPSADAECRCGIALPLPA